MRDYPAVAQGGVPRCSHLSFSFAAYFVCLCMFAGSSAPPVRGKAPRPSAWLRGDRLEFTRAPGGEWAQVWRDLGWEAGLT